MLIKGIAKGDKDLRHFTFDDEEDVTVKGGVYFYKVNYGKNKLEGEYAEDEIGYVRCDAVIPLGGRKPKPIPGREQPAETKATVQTPEPKKRGRPAKVKNLETSNEAISIAPQEGVQKFEYMVENLNMDNSADLKQFLNELGEDGWELCWFEPERSIFGSYKARAIFKRKRG